MTAHDRCAPGQDRPGPGHNASGYEVWAGTHEGGAVRRELAGLPQADYVTTFVDHCPDLTPEQRDRLAVILLPR